MSKSFESLVHTVCKHGDALATAAEALKAKARTMSYVQFRDEVARGIGTFYGVEPYASRKGGLTFEKDTAPHTKWKRMIALHADHGVTSNKAAPKVRSSVVTAAVREASAAVVAAGMTKAEFQAFIAALKDSVSFK